MDSIATVGITLAELLHGIVHSPAPQISISGLCSDSREAKPGDLFIAYSGPVIERCHYIQQAIQRGAVAILQDESAAETTQALSVPTLTTTQLNEKVGLIAARFFGNPSVSQRMIGITGTNGKTTCSQLIAKALTLTGQHCGIIGTLGYGFPDQLEPGSLTTPDAIQLQKQLAILKQHGAKSVAMEVSSHSLAQHRVAGVSFDVGVFTNLTQDHLDYHHTMQQYGQAKRRLFLQPGLKSAVINSDDAFGQELLAEFTGSLDCYSYSLLDANATVHADHIKLTPHGLSAQITSPWGNGVLHSTLLGRFNLSNLLAVFTTLGVLHIPFEENLQLMSQLTTVPGRMQTFGGGKLPTVVVDYAHTPDALEKALNALREHCHGTLWCVFGCGGNRDAGKRRLMGQAAERFSDQIIITDDNPRHEDPEKIVEDILQGLLCPWAVEIEHDRHSAIAHAIDCASANDMVLIAGKGHERYQIVGDEKIPFDDAEQVKQLLQLKNL